MPLEEDGGGVVAEVSVVAVHEAAQSLGAGHAFIEVAGEGGKEAVEAEFLAVRERASVMPSTTYRIASTISRRECFSGRPPRAVSQAAGGSSGSTRAQWHQWYPTDSEDDA